MAKILIVEDNQGTNKAICEYMKEAGHTLFSAFTGSEALKIFREIELDIIVLDIMLPEMSGIVVLHEIRKISNIPVIMLTALDDEYTQSNSFDEMADDYITKPFSPKILLCKIAAILRRRTVENQNQSLLTYKELSMDVDGFHVYQGGNEVVLTSKEFALLRLMLENQGKVFTRQMLLDRLWADDLEVEDRIVDSHIKNIRKKLNADYIKTIRGVGYRIDKLH